MAVTITLEDLRSMGFDENGNRLPGIRKDMPVINTARSILVPDYILHDSVFIPGEVPSSKNSRYAPVAGAIIPSKATSAYKKKNFVEYKKLRTSFLKIADGVPKPYQLMFFFVRKSIAEWDFHNLVQCPADMMQNAGWYDNDNKSNILIYPPFGEPVFAIDKNNPGLFVKVIKFNLNLLIR